MVGCITMILMIMKMSFATVFLEVMLNAASENDDGSNNIETSKHN